MADIQNRVLMIGKTSLAVGLALGCMLVASDGAAQQLHRANTEITDTKASATYTGGALDVTVSVLRWADTTTNALVKLTWDSGEISQTVSVKGSGGTANKPVTKVTLTDPTGLPSGCSPKAYRVSITIDGEEYNNNTRNVEVTPTCTFASSIVDLWNLSNDTDQVVVEQKDKVYLTNAVLETAPSCVAGPKIKARIVNHSKISTPSLLAQARSGESVRAQTAAAFPLAAGSYKEIVLTPVGPHDVTAKLDLAIVDWTHVLGSHIENHGLTVTTTRNCTLATTFAVLRTIAH